ncbi:DUF724 domain-containing protein 7-like isoform X2 [Rutidosis leptorrhynchoides]|uniref:DUF724 domain-containing protein 7-like isoform X2 n=1 Tax=Rutidosis leptorrhynchoides TaxID=125765 RepID=UPI003A9A0055
MDVTHHISLPFLTKGSRVEVSSDEDGLSGVWFVATVIRPPPSISDHTSNNLVYVEYCNLLADDGSTKLREYANVAYVRPPPPLDSDSNNNVHSDFELNDVVDAFYSGGWWTGVISSVVDKHNFVVTFQNPPDRLQFHISKLRIHRQWVDGKWVQPRNQRTAGLMFTVGKKVEVSFEKESLRDVWFPATILKNSGNDSFLVEYRQPGNGDEAILNKVTVDYLHIRPSPPRLRDKKFVLLEKVDAYYDFGWRSGVVTKELADNRYNVFFKHTKQEREFIYSSVRPHMEWKGGKWFNTSQGDMNGRTNRLLIDEQIEQTPPNVSHQSTVAISIMKRTKRANLDCNDTSSPPSKILRDEMLIDVPSKRQNETSVGQSDGLDSEACEINEQVVSKTENLSHGKKVHSKRGNGIGLDTPIVNSSKKRGRLANELKSLLNYHEGLQSNEISSSRVKILQKSSNETPDVAENDIIQPPLTAIDKAGYEGDVASVAPKKKKGRPFKLQTLSPKTVATSIMKRTKHANLDKDEMLINGPSKRQNETPFGQSDGFDSEGSLINDQAFSKTENLSHGKKVHSKRGSNIGLDTPIVNFSRKRGRLANELKSLLNYSEGPKVDLAETTLEINKRSNSTKDLHVRVVMGLQSNGMTSSRRKKLPGKTPDIAENDIIQPGDKAGNEGDVASVAPNIIASNLSVRRGSKKKSSRKGKRGRKRTFTINSESSDLDSEDASKEKADVRLENDTAKTNLEASFEKSLDTVLDDQPLSTWFEGVQSHGPDMEQSSKAREKRMEIVAFSDGETLPFVRSTPLWKTLESMEAFQKIPQKPHFRPLLEGVKKSAREGVTFGMMVTFSTMVDKTRGLKFDDPRSEIEDCLETLVELEDNGFDVNVIRERLLGLLEQKDKNDELEERSKRVGEKIEEHRKIQGENVDEEMEELHRQLRELEERRRRVLLKKDKRNSEICVMKTKAEKIEREMREVCVEFDRLAATPL